MKQVGVGCDSRVNLKVRGATKQVLTRINEM